MAKSPRTRYVCQECGHTAAGWMGRCSACGGWDTFVEEAAPTRTSAKAAKNPTKLRSLPEIDEPDTSRFGSGLDVVDRVLGGGVVAGSAVLLAGEPGIGKSTLLLTSADRLAGSGRPTIYVSAEESPRQLRIRAERLGVSASGLLVSGETDVESIITSVEASRPAVVIVDSIQAVRSSSLDGLPGSIGQVRSCAEALVSLAKRSGSALFLVGHITKQGHIAGPKSLEHLVDTVLTFEGEGHGEHRVLRAVKNRFGPAGEVAIFEMHDDGLSPVSSPSRALLSLRHGELAGSAVAATVHGSRPVLVEVQALVHASSLPTPRRTVLGLDSSRVALILAVLERFGGLSFADRDVYLNVVGGLDVREPAADLAIAAALVSALADRPLPGGAAFFGEIGLLGEIRPVGRADSRLREIEALGLEVALAPARTAEPADGRPEIATVRNVRELLERLATGRRPAHP